MSAATPAVDQPANRAGQQAGQQFGQEAGRAILPSGRLRQLGVNETERNYAIAMHLSPLAWFVGVGPFALAIPVVLWLVRRDQSDFNDDHGREAVNFGISFFGMHLLLAITVVGIALWPVLWIVGVVNLIRGAVAAGNGEFFRYPMTVRLIS